MGEKFNELNEKLFRNIFDFAHGGIAILSPKGEWIKVNQSIVDCLGYPEHELYGKSFTEITHKDDLDIDISHMKALLRGKIDSYQIEKRYFHKNGTIIWALLSVSLFRDDQGKPKYFISQVNDISKRKTNRSQLELMLEVAREQNNRLSNFAEIITHNLKTHTSNLSTLITFLEEESNEIILDENFELLKGSIINLSQTVSHLTEVAKIKSVDENKIEPLNLYSYVKQAIYNVSALAKNRNCKIINNVDKDSLINAIPAYLDSIILNFLTNAIKYRDENRATVIKLSSEVKNEYLIYHIEDNGLGIDLEKYGNDLFQMYKTFHKHNDALGVGLFITRNHIESLGGFVEVKSQVGVGTTFSVYFKIPTPFVLEPKS